MSENAVRNALQRVAEVVQSTEFQLASADFVDKNCDAFSFDEENRLEYTSMHQEYQELIDTKLREALSDTVDFDLLLTNLKDLMSKEPNLTPDVAEALDLLTSLGDFQDFKDMMLVAKKDREDTKATLSPVLPHPATADADFGVKECQKMFEQLASASGEDGWSVEVDKRWYRSETKAMGEQQYSRSGVVVELGVLEAVEMMTGYKNPRMGDWMGHIKDFQIVKEMGPGDNIVRAELDFHGIMAMAMSSSMPKVAYTRVILRENFPSEGEITIGKIPWDIENDCHLQSPYFKTRSMCVRPHEGAEGQTLVTTVEAASMAWMPSWIKNWMSATVAPKMMSGIVSKYKKVKAEQAKGVLSANEA